VSQDFLDILKIEADEINSAFVKAGIAGKGTPQEIAEFRETFVKQFLSRYFPFPYHIPKGKIRDSFGNISASVDCVVLHPSHPHTIDSAGKHTLIFCDGVESVTEVKPNIQDKLELERGLEQIISVKKLRRFKSAILESVLSPVDPEYKKGSLQIPCFLFATKCKTNPIDTGKEIKDFYLREKTSVENQIDAVIINKIGIIFNYKYSGWCLEDPVTKQKLKGLFFEDWKDNTLARFLFLLNQFPGVEMLMSEPVLPRYLAALPSASCTAI
jgi:hypothetical protein